MSESRPAVRLVAGRQELPVSGRAAVVLGLLAQQAAWINETPTGQVIISFADDELKVELSKSLPRIKLHGG